MKEEESSNTEANAQVKEEPAAAPIVKKEGEEETEVNSTLFILFPF